MTTMSKLPSPNGSRSARPWQDHAIARRARRAPSSRSATASMPADASTPVPQPGQRPPPRRPAPRFRSRRRGSASHRRPRRARSRPAAAASRPGARATTSGRRLRRSGRSGPPDPSSPNRAMPIVPFGPSARSAGRWPPQRREDALVSEAGREGCPPAPVAGAAARKEPSMKKILLAYDGGEPAKRALEQTIELATRFQAQVGVISVVPERPAVPRSIPGTTAPCTPRSSSRRAGPARGRHRGRAVRARRRRRQDHRADRRRARLRHDRHRHARPQQSREDAPGQRVRACRQPRPCHGRRRPLMQRRIPRPFMATRRPARLAAPAPGGPPVTLAEPATPRGHAHRLSRPVLDALRSGTGPAPVTLRGMALLADPVLNKDAAFTDEERRRPGPARPAPAARRQHRPAGLPGAGARPPQAGRPGAVHRPGRAPGPQRDAVPPRAAGPPRGAAADRLHAHGRPGVPGVQPPLPPAARRLDHPR